MLGIGVFLIFLYLSVSVEGAITDDLILVYDMDYTSGNLIDESGNGYDATTNGNPTYSVTGICSSGIDFDGVGDYFVTTANTTTWGIAGDNDKTMCGWARPNRAYSNADGAFGMGDGGLGGEDFVFRTKEDANQWTFQRWDNDINFNFGAVDTWQHLCVVYDASVDQFLIYANGTNIINQSLTDGLPLERPLFIGRWDYDTPNFDWNGTLDVIALWNRTLNASEIAILNATSTRCTWFGVPTILNYPTNVSLDIGTLEGGDVESVQVDDTDYYNVTEIVGTPVFIINYSFTYFTGFNYIEINAQYDGNLTHVVAVDIYNGSNFITLGVIPDNEALTTYEYAVADYTDYNVSGVVNLTINHTSAGNINHWLATDWIRLIHRPVITLHNTSGMVNTSPMELNFTVVDLGNATVNCTAYNGTVPIGGNASVIQNVSTILELNATEDGNYTDVFINCTDNLDYNVSSSIWIYLDSTVSGLTVAQDATLTAINDALQDFIMSALLMALIALQGILFWFGEKSENVGIRIGAGIHLVMLGFFMIFTYKATQDYVEIIGAIIILLGCLVGLRGAYKG